MEQGATKRATPAQPRAALPASAPVSSPALVGLSEPQVVRHVVEPSFEFSRNGKGDASWTIKAGGEGLEAVVSRILSIDDRIRRSLAGQKPTEIDTSGDLAGKAVARG